MTVGMDVGLLELAFNVQGLAYKAIQIGLTTRCILYPFDIKGMACAQRLHYHYSL